MPKKTLKSVLFGASALILLSGCGPKVASDGEVKADQAPAGATTSRPIGTSAGGAAAPTQKASTTPSKQ